MYMYMYIESQYTCNFSFHQIVSTWQLNFDEWESIFMPKFAKFKPLQNVPACMCLYLNDIINN